MICIGNEIKKNTNWMVGWGEKTSQADIDVGKDPRAKCWIKTAIAKSDKQKKTYLLKMFKLYRSRVPVSRKTHFSKNHWCTNKMCVNPFHYSAKGGC